MSDTILAGDITVTYLDENRQKALTWTGSATGTQDINAVYSALADLLDESTQMDDGSIMSAQTPVEYSIGIIDAGDLDPWYITYDCMEHITGGAMATSGWTHTDGSSVGIVVTPVTNSTNTFVTGDIGENVTGNTDSDSGTLLEVIIPGGSLDYLVIRPDTNAAANSFDSTQTITGTTSAHTGVQTAVATTGEQIWANFYSVTPIEADTHIYLYQGLVSDATRARIAAIGDATQDWWSEGAYDRCVFIRDYKTASNPIIDLGYVTAFARKGNTVYDSFELRASNTSGGRNPIPLSASNDLNQTTGYKSLTYTDASTTAGHWSVGDEILGGTTGARGIITQIDNPLTATQTIHYYLIGDPQTDFQTAAETCNNVDASGTGSKNTSAPADQGPALTSWFTNAAVPSVTHANTNVDIDDDGTSEGYSMTVDCNSNPLTEVYEWLKYITRNGETSTTNTDGVEGEQYEGGTVFLDYGTATPSGLLTEGNPVTQETSGATGIIVSHNTTDKEILLRNTRPGPTGLAFSTGTATDHTLTDNTTSETVELQTSDNAISTTFSPSKGSPYGTFAGGTFFGARGVVLSNWITADENSFQLTDITGTVKVRPTSITLTITNLVGTSEATITDDRVAMFRLTGSGGSVNKQKYSCVGGEAIGAATITVDGTIAVDEPGKTSPGGVLRIRDASNSNKDYRIRYTSWTGSIFTLSNIVVAAADAGTNTTTVVESGAFATARRGDLVLNTTRSNAISYITARTDNNTITISPAITGQTTGDAIEINAVPVILATADDLYVPLIDQYALTSTASASIVYNAAVYFRTRVRNVANATPIKPFEVDGSTTGTNQSVATIRTTDTIYQ